MGEAVTFTHAYVQSTVCSPSRACFLTGRYPHTTGLRANGQRIRETERLVPRILSDFGCECGLVGKRHPFPKSMAVRTFFSPKGRSKSSLTNPSVVFQNHLSG